MRAVVTWQTIRSGGVLAAIAALCLLMATPPLLALESVELAPEPKHSEISRAIYALSDRFHYQQAALDDQFSSKSYDQLIESLDGNKLYFLESDIKEFERYRFVMDDSLRSGNVGIAFEIFKRYQQRATERLEDVLAQLHTEPDFTLDERFEFDRSESNWAKTPEELSEIWRKRIKNDALSLALAGKSWEESADVLAKRYERVLKRIAQVNSDDVFEIYMNAFTHTLDPHSSYMSPRNSEEYRIQMSLSYDGIGASLQLIDDYVTIMNIIPGGPASIEGTLGPNDRITAVGQDDDKELVDVIGWRLDDVVRMIRGPGGTSVRLQILPAGAAPGSKEFLLSLTRDKIKLEAQAAKKKTVTLQRDGREFKVGVVDVPSFYLDYQALIAGDEDYTSTTKDVRRLVEELKQEGMDGLILDLRGNGGGHLREAQSLSGLFIENGPVVQLRHNTGRIEVLKDSDPGTVYDGPLVVLVNRYSASASEIFAAAIQDYGRGVVIGQQTFGKGSVQNLFPLDRYKRTDNAGFGQLTLTIGKYYRVTGGSTQHRGVMPDIQLPSPIDVETVGESTRDTALPWDQITATNFSVETSPFVGHIDRLIADHERRSSSNAAYQKLLHDIGAYREASQRKWVSLNLAERKAERDSMNGEEAITAHGDLVDAQEDADSAAETGDGASAEGEEQADVVLEATAEIVADMLLENTETSAAASRITPN